MALDPSADNLIPGQPAETAGTKNPRYGIARILGIWVVATLPWIPVPQPLR